ncbi:MBL fold metallo-hydrolase [Novosphingobium sp. JCM 18896]|uniref:MBL fold metallo-hydrolase n=1 Tax=Novosphingobium sp. JCM 18896 TaxID=2989731 RepID=UPI0022222D7C|nr:MBL fold metallo-hydrolase [Novosphingobium sp. JCM 18896]MCW1428229.1 MBL fold metallo-hydrolase [Novosphingobium sp. JCM 18896]
MEFEILPVTRFQQNCSILWCEKTRRAAVIDPGGDISEILNFIDMLDLEPEVALVTHGHFDHCGGAAQFAEMTGARIEGPHMGDAPLVARLEGQGAFFAEMARARAANEEVVAQLERQAAQPRGKVRSYEPLRWLDHGDRVRFGEEELEVLHCPGHSKGHVAYFSRSARQAFVGDILFRHTIGAWEHPDGDLPTLIDSIRNRLFPLGDDVAFVPGHGDTSTFGHEREANPFVGDEAFARWSTRFPGSVDPTLAKPKYF